MTAPTEPETVDPVSPNQIAVPAGGPARTPAEGASAPAARPAPSAALVDGTDQFEVLRLPKSRTSPLPPAEPTE